jgi:hypothetical protein
MMTSQTLFSHPGYAAGGKQKAIHVGLCDRHSLRDFGSRHGNEERLAVQQLQRLTGSQQSGLVLWFATGLFSRREQVGQLQPQRGHHGVRGATGEAVDQHGAVGVFTH